MLVKVGPGNRNHWDLMTWLLQRKTQYLIRTAVFLGNFILLSGRKSFTLAPHGHTDCYPRMWVEEWWPLQPRHMSAEAYLKSAVSRLFVQQVVQAKVIRKHQSSAFLFLWGEPAVIGGFPSQKASEAERASMLLRRDVMFGSRDRHHIG